MTSKTPHILVVGAGIVGSSLAYQLARQRVRVTLLSSPIGATETSFSWINGGYDTPEFYTAFRQQAIADWHRLDHELNGRLRINWSGALTWYDDAAVAERIARKLIQAGYPVRLVDQPELRRLEPSLVKLPPQVLFAEAEGAIDSVRATDLFCAAARHAGATVQRGNEVLALTTAGSRVTGVVTAAGQVTADVVVLAAGVSTPRLCQPLGVVLPLHESPAILMAFHTSQPFVNRIVSTPFMDIRAASPTLTLAAGEYVDESVENSPLAIAQRTLDRLREEWLGTEPITIGSVRIGQRPMPLDGLPIIGPVSQLDGLYLSVMHAGVTLAALAGRLVTRDLLGRQDGALLAPYRPVRFELGR